MSLDIQKEKKKLQPFGFLGKDFAVMQITKGENNHDNNFSSIWIKWTRNWQKIGRILGYWLL